MNVLNFICVHSQTLTQSDSFDLTERDNMAAERAEEIQKRNDEDAALARKEVTDSMHPKHVESDQEDDESTKAAKIAKRAEDWAIYQKKAVEITSNLRQELFTATAELNRAKLAEAEFVPNYSRHNKYMSTNNALITKKCQLAVDKLTLLLSRPPWIHRLREGNQQQWLCSDDQSQFAVAVGDTVR